MKKASHASDPRCAKCSVPAEERICNTAKGRGPEGCPTVEIPEASREALRRLQDPETLEFARQATIQEAECYAGRGRKPFVSHPVKPRLQEIVEFARKMNYKRLGVVFCDGLRREAAAVTRVLEHQGFQVVSVVCKVGGVPKEQIGISEEQKILIGEEETMCNPIAQAEVLNQARTDFNILVGLCVGHDSLFFKHAAAYTTVLAAKDRVLGHNPLAAVYTLGSYSEWLLDPTLGEGR